MADQQADQPKRGIWGHLDRSSQVPGVGAQPRGWAWGPVIRPLPVGSKQLEGIWGALHVSQAWLQVPRPLLLWSPSSPAVYTGRRKAALTPPVALLSLHLP